MPAEMTRGEEESALRDPAPLQEQEYLKLKSDLAELRSALEDILVLAHATGEASKRITKMERRALAALSGKPHLAS